ncbi:stage III sporulation protein AG [Bacillus sp. FJAT-49732]|uniref:Stage III sporulation protein AG n=1 Tax=Lederbergia citrisecunda TaxID=2833583 RepID=A0A942TL54_9BACI|nr:stage III sporulation protein AG [Lederbergia citrisecunda]MBS4199630.1 stage III sporulation protein AG [Lederbergia citrisecunda]
MKNKHSNPIDWLKEKLFVNKTPNEKNKVKPYYLLFLLILGALFMMLGTIWKETGDRPNEAVFNENNGDQNSSETFGVKKSDNNDGMKVFEEQYENQLKEALEEIVGVHSVTVIVNVQATERKVYEKNTILKNQTTHEEDEKGGQRQIEDQSKEDQLVIIREGEKDIPLVMETRKPEIKGVLVVAGGAENIQVKKWIIEAVTRVLDVPSHKVAVMPKKSKGDS